LGNKVEVNSIETTKKWVELFIIKNNFCPFAAKPFQQNTIRYFSTDSKKNTEIVDDLISELIKIRDSNAEEVETTLLILTECLIDFDEYNQFLDIVDEILEEMDLTGEFQVASFHPDYCFADLTPDDVRNYTNRSPYPMFHLIREKSVESARITYPNIELIPENNMAVLLKMGLKSVFELLSRIK